jgi:hypothetical protein
VAWVFAENLGELRRHAYFPLACGMLAAFVAIAIETIVFALSSPVPILWYSSGLPRKRFSKSAIYCIRETWRMH